MSQLELETKANGVLKLVVAYDGTGFHGFAAQRDQRTVEGLLTEVLAHVVRAPVTLSCAGRTDAGVHAWGQVASVPLFDASEDVAVRAMRAVNGKLAPEVVVRAADVVDAPFDARRAAQWRCYRYTIVNSPAPDPFLARYAWWVPTSLDLSLLRLAADPLMGEHDFASFCRAGPAGSTTTRRVLDSHWTDRGGGVLEYEVRATAFCWQMVRSIVGTLVDVGTGRFTPGDVLRVLRARDRAVAGRLAPPQGLSLYEVGY